MTITPQALDFLFENKIKDSKEWYREHKDMHRQLILNPFGEFITTITPYINEIDPVLVCNPKKISRIYRDTRFSKDKSVFRDTVWCSFMRGSEIYEGMPAFFFEFSPRGFDYGMGYYKASTKSMEVFRKLIVEKDKTYKKARSAFDKQDVFALEGDLYKKNHFPQETEKDCDWLNRRSVCFMTYSKDFDLLFSDRLADKIGKDFLLLKPQYDFLLKCESEARI